MRMSIGARAVKYYSKLSLNAASGSVARNWRVGLVGAGYVSQHHLRSLKRLSNVEVVGIADLDHERAENIATRFGVKGRFRSLQEMIHAARPDVVHVLTPPGSHCSLTLKALDAGCHVLVEKPMATNADECERMLRKAESVGRVLSVNHSARFDPAVLRGLRIARSGRIGTLLAVAYIRSSEYPPFAGGTLPEHYRSGGYPFRDLGVHALSVIEAFLGEIQNVDSAFESSGRQMHLRFDEWQARVKCASGIGQIYLSWNSRPMQNRIVVHGTAGRLTIDSFLETCTLERALPGDKLLSLMWNGTVVPLALTAKVTLNAVRFALGRSGRAPDIQGSITQFYSALTAGRQPPVTAAEGKRIVSWIDKVARPADELCRRSRPASDLRPAEVLVTGASGFLGRRLVDALLGEGMTVRVMLRRPSNSLGNQRRLRVVYGDLGQAEAVDEAVKGVATVFHIGAATSGNWEDYQCGTIHGTRNVADAALRYNAKVVHVSSLSVLDYACIPEGSRIDESAPLEQHPDRRGFYPKSKLEAERIILDRVKRGLNAVMLRPGQIFGPGAEQSPPYGAFAIGARWVVAGSGKAQLPLVYVDDVVDALRQAASAQVVSGSIFHLVDAARITQHQYLDAHSAQNPQRTITYIPLAVLYGAAAALETSARLLKRSVPLTTYRLRALKRSLQFDCSAAHRNLGWVPRIGIAEGLRLTFGDRERARDRDGSQRRLSEDIRPIRENEPGSSASVEI